MFGLTLSPWILVSALASVITIGGAGYFKGDADAANRYKVKIEQMQIVAQQQVEKVRLANKVQAETAVNTLETQNAKSRIIYRTITQNIDKIVDRTVYANACLDTDGLMLVNAALAGVVAEVGNPGQPHNAMPSSNPAQ